MKAVWQEMSAFQAAKSPLDGQTRQPTSISFWSIRSLPGRDFGFNGSTGSINSGTTTSERHFYDLRTDSRQSDRCSGFIESDRRYH